MFAFSKPNHINANEEIATSGNKSISNMCCCCTVIYNRVGGVILIKQYADKGRKDACMDEIAFPDPCVGQQMRFLQ